MWVFSRPLDACGGGGGGSGGGRTKDGGEDEDDDKVEVEVPGGFGEPHMTPV